MLLCIMSIANYLKLTRILATQRTVIIAITIPVIPNILPNLDDSGCDKPLNANMNSKADIKYKIATIFADI